MEEIGPREWKLLPNDNTTTSPSIYYPDTPDTRRSSVIDNQYYNNSSSARPTAYHVERREEASVKRLAGNTSTAAITPYRHLRRLRAAPSLPSLLLQLLRQ